jgi:hypothetical protein
VRRWIVGLRAGLATGLATGLAVSVVAGCGSNPPAPTPTPSTDSRPADRDQLAGLAAVAKDKKYVATYQLVTPDRPARTVTVAFGTDGTWVVGIPGGVLSGLADVAMFGSAAGQFQCLLGPAAGTAGARPDLGSLAPSCTALASPTKETDPLVQHIFTDWIDALVDRATALSVAATAPLADAQGACYSVESNSTALAPPLQPGVYCYSTDGLLTAARVGFGTLTLAGTAAPAPPSVTMPAPLVDRAPTPVVAPAAPPPPPPPSPSASA